jgi:hypothetical protein
MAHAPGHISTAPAAQTVLPSPVEPGDFARYSRFPGASFRAAAMARSSAAAAPYLWAIALLIVYT